MTRIAIIDYDLGNVRSILNAFQNAHAEIILTRDANEIMTADGIVLPGVGAFGHGMEKLSHHGLIDIIKDFAATGKPLLGICLGMQMLMDESEEFDGAKGLGLITGKVVKITPQDQDYPKLPHISWNEIIEPFEEFWKDSILDGLTSGQDMYFVHSYVVAPENSKHILSKSNYSNFEFCSAIKNGNIYGCQFHPEKSATEGLKIIHNFSRICKR